MTILAYRNGVLAARARTITLRSVSQRVAMLARTPSGWRGGAIGESSDCEAFLSWLDGGPDFSRLPIAAKRCHGLLIDPSRQLYCLSGAGVVSCSDPFVAVGSGSDFAYGAMEMGASAEQAVAVAIRRDRTAGGSVVVMLAEHAAPPALVDADARGTRPPLDDAEFAARYL
jgi:ATP-dependent HslUV protease subunit HslV